MSENTRTIKPKPYKVIDNDGKTHLVYALTEAGAIRDVRRALQREETWTAELATGEGLYLAARDKVSILNAPASIAAAAPQIDAFGGGSTES